MKGGWPYASMPAGDLPFGVTNASGDPTLAHLTDPYASRIYLIEATPVDADGVEQSVYLSSTKFATGASDTPSYQLYRPRLISPYNVENTILNAGRPGGRSIPAYGGALIANPDGELDDYGGWSWSGRPFLIKAGTENLSYSQFPKVFDGSAEEVVTTEGTVGFSILGKHATLARPSLQANRYKGLAAALLFDGVNDHANTTHSCPANAMTMEVYARPTTTPATLQVVMSYRNGAGAAGVRNLIVGADAALASSSGNVAFQVRNDANTSFVAAAGTGTIVAGALTHIAGVLDTSAGEIRLYVNGVLEDTVAVTGTFATTISNLDIGRSGGSASNYYDGAADEVRTWTGARTVGQILETKDRELSGVESGLSYYNKCNDGSGSTATATVGSNLTLTGATWTNTYEGTTSNAGQPKPLAFGHNYQVAPTLIDPIALVYQVHDGNVDSIPSVQERGAEVTPAGDVADLYATSVTAGQFKTDISRGLFRLGSAPTGKILATVLGDKAGASYVNTTGEIIARILVTRLGLTTDDVDTGAFSALAGAQPAPVGLFMSSENGLVDTDVVIDGLIQGIGGYWTVKRGGKITAGLVTDPALGVSTYTLTEADIRLDSIERIPLPAPTKLIRVGYRPYTQTLTLEESATGLTTAVRHDYAQPERFAQAENSTVSGTWKNATEWAYSTHFRDYADATDETARQLAIYETPRDAYRVPLARGFFRFEIGDVCDIDIERFGLSGGKNFLVIGFTEDAANDDASVVVWG